MCWHRYEYLGDVEVYFWAGGVAGGMKVVHHIKAKQCRKCGKLKEVE